MAGTRRGATSAEDIRRFCRQLSAYPDPSLRMIHEYYTDDLTYILENLHTGDLLHEINSRNVLKAEKYRTIKEQVGAAVFTHTLLQDILDRGREAVIGLWECLYALHKHCPHPNLLSILEEIQQTGNTPVPAITTLMKYSFTLIIEPFPA